MTIAHQWEKVPVCGEDVRQWVEDNRHDGRRWFPGRMGGGPMMSRDTNSADSQKKAAETKEKKIKKILTKEQYEKWQAEQNSARKKASQRRMHKDNHPDKGPDFEQKNL